jgi:hypothetical protein
MAAILAEVAADLAMSFAVDDEHADGTEARVVVYSPVHGRALLELSCDSALARLLTARVFHEPPETLGDDDEHQVLAELAHALADRVRLDEFDAVAHLDAKARALCFRLGGRRLVIRLIAATAVTTV